MFRYIIIILVITVIILMCLSCKKIDNFDSFNCEAIQNKYYTREEILHKSGCPNVVILEKTNGYFAENGDINGPYFSKDYIRYYYMGVSNDGLYLDPNLDYSIYYYPWYNPRRWLYGRYSQRNNRRRNKRKNNTPTRPDIPSRPNTPTRPNRPDIPSRPNTRGSLKGSRL